MSRPERVLVIRTGGLGDFILSLPVIRALATARPHAEIEILGRPAMAALARPHVSGVTSIDDRRFARLFADTPLDIRDPAATYLASFDLVVTFLGSPDSDFGRKLQSLVPQTLFIPAPPPGAKHAVIHFLEQIRFAEIGATSAVPRIDLSEEHHAEGKRLLARLIGPAGDDPPILVHPGSGGRHKNWPSELFARTVRLFRQSGRAVILLEGEADRAAVREVGHHLREDQIPVMRDATLVQVAAAMACSQLVVGNDSGISHLAAAVGTPLVCLFGPTDPAVWRPLGAAVQILTFPEATPERVYHEGLRLTTYD